MCVCVHVYVLVCVECVKGGFILSFISLRPRPAYLLTTTHIDSHTQIFSCLAKDKVMWVCVCVCVRWVQLSASFLWPPLLGVCECWTEGGHEDFTLISSLMKRLRVGVGVLRERNAGRWSTFHCQLQWSSVCVNKTDSESSNKKTFFGVFCWKFLTWWLNFSVSEHAGKSDSRKYLFLSERWHKAHTHSLSSVAPQLLRLFSSD